MQSITEKLEAKYKKSKVVDVKSGDTVRVHQKIREGSKERVQVFEGLVIRAKRTGSLTSSITVRRIASGVGVEKSFLLHSPLIEKVEVVKRSDVNRNYLTYMRNRSGKSARLESVDFDREAVNAVGIEELRDQVIEADTEEDAADSKPRDNSLADEKPKPEKGDTAKAKEATTDKPKNTSSDIIDAKDAATKTADAADTASNKVTKP